MAFEKRMFRRVEVDLTVTLILPIDNSDLFVTVRSYYVQGRSLAYPRINIALFQVVKKP